MASKPERERQAAKALYKFLEENHTDAGIDRFPARQTKTFHPWTQLSPELKHEIMDAYWRSVDRPVLQGDRNDCMKLHLWPVVEAGNRELTTLSIKAFYRTAQFVLELDNRRRNFKGYINDGVYPIGGWLLPAEPPSPPPHPERIRHLQVDITTALDDSWPPKEISMETLLFDPHFALRCLLRAKQPLDITKNAKVLAYLWSHPPKPVPNNMLDTQWQQMFPALETLSLSILVNDFYARDDAGHVRVFCDRECLGQARCEALLRIFQDTEIIITAKKTMLKVCVEGCHEDNEVDDSIDTGGTDIECNVTCQCERRITAALQALVRR